MAEKTDTPQDDSEFHASTPQANRAAHAGQGVGQRELEAMRDAGEEPGDADLTPDPDDDTDPPNA